jgi:hypothetical protein
MSVVTAYKTINDYGDATPLQSDYVEVYEVEVDDLTHDAHYVGSSTMLPQMLQPYGSNPWARLISKHPQRSGESPYIWIVTCRYSTKLPEQVAQALINPNGSGGNAGGSENSIASAMDPNPLNRPVRWVARTLTKMVALDKDVLGRNIDNSAGEPLDPPPTVKRAMPVFELTKNLATYDQFAAMCDYVGCINKTPYLGKPSRTMLLDDIGAETQHENGVSFVTVRAVFVYDKNTHYFTYLDAGYHELINGSIKPIILPSGQRPARPVPLNGNGLRIVVPANNQAGIAGVYRNRQINEEKEFKDLGLF